MQMIVYIDTSAALQLVIEEKESQRLAETLQAHLDAGNQLASSFLLFTEMHCGADRSRSGPRRGGPCALSGPSR